MGKLVLTVGGAVFQPPKLLDDFRVETVHAGFVDRFGARFENILIHRFAFLFKDLFNICRMNATIRYKTCQRAPGNFTADGVKAGDGDSLRGIIHYNINASCLFEGLDVAPVASNNAPLHLLIGECNHRGGYFGNLVGGDTLDGIGDQFAGFFHAGFSGINLILADDARHVSAGFLLDFFKQDRAGFFAGHRRNALQFCEPFII